MLWYEGIIKTILVAITTFILTFQPTGEPVATETFDPTDDITVNSSAIHDPLIAAYEKPLDDVLRDTQQTIAHKARIEAKRQEEALSQVSQDERDLELTPNDPQPDEPEGREESPQPVISEEKIREEKIEVSASPQQPLRQYVSLNGTSYAFEELALDTKAAQNYIDANPNSFGYWRNITYATTFDVLFAHYYAAGQLVFNAQVGSTVIMHFRDGTTETYKVVAKTIQPVKAYYDASSNLWKEVGLDFDLMIKTCYEVNVTDIIITLVKQ